VVKYGGNAMVDPALAASFAEDIVLMHSVGLRPVVVHGGGPQISDLMERLGKVPEFRDGQRVTDAETVDIARMVLVGKVNREIVGSINVHGPLAVGVSGEDAGLIRAEARHPDLGFVGDVDAVNPAILERLLPRTSSRGVARSAPTPGQAYNINADTVAGALAEALRRREGRLPHRHRGLLARRRRPGSLISQHRRRGSQAMVDDGTLTGGMIPKIAACLARRRGGVGSAHLLDGRLPARRAARAVQRRRHRHDDQPTSEPCHGAVADGRDAMGRAARARPLSSHAHVRATCTAARAGGGLVALGQGRHAVPRPALRARRHGVGPQPPRRGRRAQRPGPDLLHVSNLFGTDVGWQVACTLDRLLGTGQPGWPADGTRGTGVLRQLRGRGPNECALKLARKFGGRGRHVVVSAFGSFHRPHTRHAPRDGPAGQARGLPAPARGLPARRVERPRCARGAPRPAVAAVLLEPVQGEGGVNPRPAEYFQACAGCATSAGSCSWSTRCRPASGAAARGSRTSSSACVPDVVTMAKALGNGVPIGACWAKREVAAAFEPGDHATTYGGQPLATAAARAVLEVMEAEDVPARAERAGARLAGAVALPGVAEVRGSGCCSPSSSTATTPRTSRAAARARRHRQRRHPDGAPAGAIAAHHRRRGRPGRRPARQALS
jgi:acetylglutamate kinase